MKRQLTLALGVLFLLAGWFSAFMLNSVPDRRTLYIIFPTLFLGAGMSLVFRVVSGKLTALTLALTAVMALATLNQVSPDNAVSLKKFRKNFLDQAANGQTIPLAVDPEHRSGFFATQRSFKAFTAIEAQLYAVLPGVPGSMTFDEQERLYVSLPDLGAVYQLSDQDQNGHADRSVLYTVDLDRPSGLVWHENSLIIAEPSQILSISDQDGDNKADTFHLLMADLPDDGGHWKRSLLKQDELLYFSVGSRCNACEEDNNLRATLQQFNLSGTERITYARGLRSVVGLAESMDGILWCSDNGRTAEAAQYHPDELNRIERNGDYGWPNCYAGQKVDRDFGTKEICRATQASQAIVPLEYRYKGIIFGHNLKAPDTYRSSLYAVLSSLSDEQGSRLIRYDYLNDQLKAVAKEFVRFDSAGGASWGSLESLIVGPDGALYATDVLQNAIYRFQWPQP